VSKAAVTKVSVTLVSVFLLLALSASAQVPSGNIFFGYSYDRANLSVSNSHNLNGWEGSLEGKVLPWVGIVADFSGHYGTGDNFPNPACTGVPGVPCSGLHSNASVHHFLFGPRVSVPIGRFTPFAHALFGAVHVSESASFGLSASDTSFATGLGGGIDYRLIHGIAWRFQGDYLQTRFFGNTQNNARFSTGLVLRF
jgi:opacity protein-like surface antigen